jgi:hypothetical protein
MLLRFEAFGPARARTPYVPPAGMRLQEYVLAYDEGRRCTVYLAAHAHGAAFGDAYLFDGKSWMQVVKGATAFATTQKLGGFYDEARAGVATWNFEHDFGKHRYVAKGLLFDVRNGLSPIPARGDDPIAELEGETKTGTFDYMGLFAPDPRRAVTACLTRRGVWELDADAVWRKRAELDASVPRAWDDDGAGATYDPVRRRAIFWFYARAAAREYAFFSWDGQTLTRMSADGLPMKSLHIGLFDPAALIAAHPQHGLVLLAGEHGAFAFDGARWNTLPASRGAAPPRMKNGRMVFDANVGGFVVGPGYHEGDPGGQEQQRVFFVERRGTWERMGVRAVPSKLEELWPDVLHVNARGVWYAIGTRDLRTLRWSDTDFVEIAPKLDLESERIIAAADARGTPTAVTNRGAVWRFEDARWTRAHAAHAAFGDRAQAALAWDIAGERLVAWSAGDTFFFAGGVWTKAKKHAVKKGDGDARLLYDGALGRVVRFGGAEVALLERAVWSPVSPKHYTKLCGPHLWAHFPAHDAKTGETVLVNLERGAVVRFDVTRCEDVATIDVPGDVDVATIRDTLSFERSTRLLHAQNPARSSHRLALDLGPAFDAARSLGPRKVPARHTREVPAVAARLYHPKKRTFWFVEGDLAHAGPIGEAGAPEKVDDAAAAIAAKKKAGFVPADKLPIALLASLAATKSRALRLGKTTKTPSTSRAFGAPSIGPKARPHGMTFVFQLDARRLLRKHAGVAVFANAEATTVVLVKKWTKAPVGPSRPLVAQAARYELDEARVKQLTDADPAMTTAFERFVKRAEMQTSVTSKLGGSPLFLEPVEIPAQHTFFGQVELEGRDYYVFVSDDEKAALALTRPSGAR